MFYGMGRGGTMARGGGRGFGFRGVTPPWPYIGRGRGGLPRCGYFYGGGSYMPQANPNTQATPAYAAAYPGAVGGDNELSYLLYQAEVLKKQLEQIELKIRDLEAD